MSQGYRAQAVRTLARQPHPPGIYASKYERGLALAICRRVAAGETLRSICRDDPAMPTQKTVWNWERRHPQFRGWMAWARTKARDAAVAKHAERVAAKRATPSRTGRCAWTRGRIRLSAEAVEGLLDRLACGEPLYRVCREPEMPSLGTVYNWLRAHPAFAEQYRRAKAAAVDAILETAVGCLPWAETGAVSMRELKRIHREALARCGKIWPKRYAPPAGPSGDWR